MGLSEVHGAPNEFASSRVSLSRGLTPPGCSPPSSASTINNPRRTLGDNYVEDIGGFDMLGERAQSERGEVCRKGEINSGLET